MAGGGRDGEIHGWREGGRKRDARRDGGTDGGMAGQREGGINNRTGSFF